MMLLFAGLWLAAATHCSWEQYTNLSVFICQPTHSPNPASPSSHCDDEFCGAVEGGDYLPAQERTSELPQAAANPSLLVSLVQRFPDEPSSEQRYSAIPVSPPQLLNTWHFVSRAALPVRAPSVAS